ncbi:polysaccharide pyruvyl transferase family protein [Pseudogracilibacillus sp. SE30717A]|uniref:polysaccharide pyruvyl transferase family protein n=1 Tax=Pseudogracilibacillus sp. SE30717A TaxID=3098293 RepID=UPI00300DDDCB
MQKKIGIITLNGYVNYGNRLQNYALQEVVKSYGFDVETIWVDIKKNNPKDIPLLIKAKNILKSSPKDNYERLHNKVTGILYKKKLNNKRERIFRNFSRKHIHETTFKLDENNINKGLLDEYEYFITGSDQVWNPFFRKGDPAYFLTFAPKEKRIAYSPSFGTDQIPEDYIDRYKKWISEMHRLSVREEAGAKIIKELTGRDAPVLIDPTLMLSKEKWLSIANVPSNKPKTGYLLTYFLGRISRAKRKIINKIAKNNHLKIINLAQPNDKLPYLSGPSEFIDYINSSSIFITDSFHGAVFSILLETPFVVFDREGKFPSMNSRIDTLLSTFKFETRHVDKININSDLLKMDFSHVHPILKLQRQKAFEYLEDALNLK